ncbi:MAG: efflux RND transporter periplasmic adaptor subunit [Candidatus Omnitrophica bacterium]|nr:efflux RND transporter periplasmic adaptor subunit [Candidatus Omnitrophota bacterium]
MASKSNKILLILVGVMAVAVIAINGCAPRKEKSATLDNQEEKVYQCPMHPQIVQDHPGKCPICHMDLQLVKKSDDKKNEDIIESKERKILYYRHPMNPSITSPSPAKDDMGMDFTPVYEEGGATTVAGRAQVNIPLYKQQLIGVTLGEVAVRDLTKIIYTVGRVAYDPMLYQLQEEYISALKAMELAEGSPVSGAQERAEALLKAAELRLRLSGYNKEQIMAMSENGQPNLNLLIPGEDQKIWVYADIYEQDIHSIKTGQMIEVSLSSMPGQILKGKIAAVDPNVNTKTRTALVRAEISDPQNLLRPGMYANVRMSIDLGKRLSIARSAVLNTGTRYIVYIAQGDGRFEPREIKVGMRAENLYEVLEGLPEGQTVATSGNFLIDAESQLYGSAGGSAFYSGQEAAESSTKGKVSSKGNSIEGSHHD